MMPHDRHEDMLTLFSFKPHGVTSIVRNPLLPFKSKMVLRIFFFRSAIRA